jgi:uncharacterized protein YbjT (DUF2867 family)
MELPLSEQAVCEEWWVLRQFLPPGWQEQARSSGALRRARGVSGADALLRVLLIHLATGCSLAETAVRARQAGLAELSAVALFKRLQAAEEWLRWLAAQERVLLAMGVPATHHRVRAVDATAVSEPGSTGTDWRIHYAINLADLQCDFFELTDVRGGETWRRIPVAKGDVLLGDRIYANPAGVEHVLRAGGDVIVRMNLNSLPLYDQGGQKLDLLKLLRRLRVGEICDLPAWVRPQDGPALQGRLIALRRSAAATRQARKILLRKASKQQKRVSPRSWEAAKYFTLWTSLPASIAAAEILEFYRCRWQIELSFKRMKSILGLGHLPKKDPGSARAWLHGKLLTSLLVERIIQAADAFSPWGYRVETPPEPMARGRVRSS